MDDMNTVVFAIRGSQTFIDWAVNFRPAPASPQGFLDDPGNLCHSGFLSVAKSMTKPVAARKNCSLLITGHSAGGAVASLLFMHMMAETVRSELTELTSAFKRVHCVTFGTPPLSLLPLQKAASARHRKSLFFSFINEGDPVVRADKAFVRSLLSLYASPAPGSSCIGNLSASLIHPGSKQQQQQQLANPPNSSSHTNPPKNPSGATPPVWKVPEAKLSNAGRLVLLRELPHGSSGEQTVLASQVTDEMLRGVVFGDPVMHSMRVYARRIDVLATRAVTGKNR
ncbi:Alpha/Beta hydrolase protein [Cryomyces antarcticus]